MCLACVEFAKNPRDIKDKVKELMKQNEITIEHAIELLVKINKELSEDKKA